MGKRRYKPAGLVPPCWQQLLYCTPGSPHQQESPGASAAHRLCSHVTRAALWLLDACTWQADPRISTAHRPGSLAPAAAAVAPGSLCWQAGHRVPIAWWLGSSMPAAASVAPGSWCPNTSRHQGFHCLVEAPDNSSLLALLPHGHPQLTTQGQKTTTTHASEPQVPHFTLLLVPGGFPPHKAWKPSTSHQAHPWGEPPLPCQRAGTQLLHWVVICHSVGAGDLLS
jgi:hypothetical protein